MLFNAKNLTFLIPEKEKLDKKGFGTEKLQAIFEWYQSVGETQTDVKENKFKRLTNLAYGKINPEDYLGEELPQEFGFRPDALEDHGLAFYPIIPLLRNAVLDGFDKSYMEWYVQAINPEHTNQIKEELNSTLRDMLVQSMTELFLSDNPNPTEEQVKLFQESEKLVKATQLDHRSEIEGWANHLIRVEDQRFNMKAIARQLLDQIFITENPTIHINYFQGDYYPEVLNEKDTFFLRNPYSRDYSDAQMFGWFNYLNYGGILNKYAQDLTEDDLMELDKWNNTYSSSFIINNEHSSFTGNRVQDQESTQNYLTFKRLKKGTERRYEDPYNTLIRETTIYFLVPRKVYKLTYKSANVEFQDIVDENFRVTYKPRYKKGEPRSEYSLIEGEHIEAFWYNELWKGVCLEPNTNNYSFNLNTTRSGEKIWIQLKKHEIQYSDPQFRYGVRIPVHGGSITNFYNDSFSVTEKTASLQIMYNWIWNRCNQLLSTEVGKFLIINQNMIPHESMEESWGKNNLLKFLMVGRDTSIAPIDASLNHLGQSNLQTGIGQVVDLTKTQEILEKAELARRIKIECFSLVGITEEFLYGNISPTQTATSVAQGMQRSSSQIQHLYTRLNEILRNARNTMIETAQYIASNNPVSQISYMTSDGARQIFETNTDGFLLHKLNIFPKNTLEDIDVMERIKQLALTNNTMGANTLEMATMQMAKSSPELMAKLKDLNQRKQKELQEERQFELQKQREAFEQQQQLIEKQKAEERRSEERKHEKDILVAQIRALGYTNSSAPDIVKQFSELEKMDLAKNAFEQQQIQRQLENQLRQQQLQDTNKNKQDDRILEEKIRLKQLAQKDRELDIREKEAKNTDKRTDKM